MIFVHQRILADFAVLLSVFFLCSFNSLSAQDKTVKGRVFDENGVGMIGVVVYDTDNKKNAVLTDAKGDFKIVISKSCKTLTISYLGYVNQVLPLNKVAEIYLEPDSQSIQETVITGIFTRRKDSFTGAVQAISSEEIRRVGNSNVIQSLKNLDPSLLVLENLEQGSNPNAMASMQIRGASSLSSETTNIKSDFLNKANTPLFILDGFETSLVKIKDMDMNRIQSITILKDASAKAIYGSKGANGVIVIETKALTNERSAVTYTGNITFEAPDLSSYNLCNSFEKLEIERREGFYHRGTSEQYVNYMKCYYDRLKKALEGESTYWLSKPLRLGISNKHSIGVELGGKELKALATFAYNDNNGTMKGSYRNVISGDINLSYRRDKWTFRNIMSIAYMRSEDSPYGTFNQYAILNPYFTPFDRDGNIKKILFSGVYGEGENKADISDKVANPLYNATIGTKDSMSYLDFSDNFYVEYQLFSFAKIVGRIGVNSKKTEAEEFKPADHTDFIGMTDADALLRRGIYDMSNGSFTTFSADISAQLNHQIKKKHDIFATAQYNISETQYKEVTHYTQGFPNSNMKSITFARQYALNTTPSGADGLNRNLGFLLTSGYSYDNRYMADATIKASASSVFGTNRKWGTFWSAGLAWNIHNEKFMAGMTSFIKMLKLRGSVGSSGNQNFSTNVSLPVYSYYNNKYYNGFAGTTLNNMENPLLSWEEKMDYNIGVDFRTKRLNLTLDAYIADTRFLVFSMSALPSTGFLSVNDNLGMVRNKGIEAGLSYTLYQRGSSYLSVFGKVAFNDNRVLRISDALRSYNKKQQEQAASGLTPVNKPVVMYYDNMPLHSIWAVRSLGINPVDGHEIFLDKNGNLTSSWKAADMVNCGSYDPLFTGNFGLNGEIKGIGINLVFTFYGGGRIYNKTLIDKVENTGIENNVDRRIFSGRWHTPGQEAKYRNGLSLPTKATTRFIQRNNVLNISSLSAYYEFPLKLVRKVRMQRLRTTFYLNDLATFSSIDIERGTSYPYARSVSLSLTATF